MSEQFRDLLKQVGSGTHTSEAMTRAESQMAMTLMLQQQATPAQIGAFMIAHRIRRPTGEELAGMLDAYDDLGPVLSPLRRAATPLVLNSPYDGRSRTAPVSPLVSLVLAAMGQPTLMHGGNRMPTKYGIAISEVWQLLGVDWTQLSLPQVQQVMEVAQVGFVYVPRQFPLAEGLVTYRAQIGKRPPSATLELLWSPYSGPARVAFGFVHPPTEERAQITFAQRHLDDYIAVKGLEGSCDLPQSRACILGVQRPQQAFQRLILHPNDYGMAATDVPLPPPEQFAADMQGVLQGARSPLAEAVVWSSGFYLWQTDQCPSLEDGLALARESFVAGKAKQALGTLQQAIAAQVASP
ncbi:MAG: anthranilate phosphoribosyltransferase family protein [Cyanobacteria bacterium P01_A01_bin.135]